mmetsp:Transcript_22124/g.28661  ORF Transcript_22124/g.28661 Transcript_22124/m.28661 type:complete len:758 (+) Transcript_22124:120-2393(+)
MQGLDDFNFGDISRINEKKVTINLNGQFEGGKALYIQSDWTLESFLRKSAERLELAGGLTRCFNADGIEMTDMMMISDGDMLFLSNGDDYVSPGFTGEDSLEDSDRGDIPKAIGGWKVTLFLGRGGFGEVRVGEHQLSGERVALKFMKKAGIADISAVERTNTEVQCLLALKHPHIITLLQHLVTPTYIVLAFELMEGGDLYEHLASLPDSAVSEEEAREIFIQVLGAVGHAHNNHICHRDLKLENILIVDKEPIDGNLQVKIADFGLSDFYRPGAHVRTNCGSLSYLAPEVFRGTSNAGPPLDVWSMGVILFALLCGRLPFEGSDLRGNNRPKESAIRKRITQCQYKIDETLSPEARDLIRRMLKLDPSERASVPEIFGHCWLRSRGYTAIDVPQMRSNSSGRHRLEVGVERAESEDSGADVSVATERTSNPPPVERESDEVTKEIEVDGLHEEILDRTLKNKSETSRNYQPGRTQGSARLEEGGKSGFKPNLLVDAPFSHWGNAARHAQTNKKCRDNLHHAGLSPSPTRLNRRTVPNDSPAPSAKGTLTETQLRQVSPSKRGPRTPLPNGLSTSPEPRRRVLKEAGFMRSTASSGNRRAMINNKETHSMKVLGSSSEMGNHLEEREQDEHLSRQRRRDLSSASQDSGRSHRSNSPVKYHSSSSSPRNFLRSRKEKDGLELPLESTRGRPPLSSSEYESSRELHCKVAQEKHGSPGNNERTHFDFEDPHNGHQKSERGSFQNHLRGSQGSQRSDQS